MSHPESGLEAPPIRQLVIVCCHAIWLGGQTRGEEESEWLIEPFQKGETPTFLAHVRAGVKQLEDRRDALLVFSGGATKTSRTNLSEGQSYLNLARTLSPSSLHSRMIAEINATDSYQNILFSLLRYHAHLNQCCSLISSSSTLSNNHLHSPIWITIISHDFKRERLLYLHIPAIRFPGARTSFVGIDPPAEVTSRASLEKGEAEKGWGAWKCDLYGTKDNLGGKRTARGWVEEDMLEDMERYIRGATEREQAGLRGLLRWKGGVSGSEIYRGYVPWDR